MNRTCVAIVVTLTTLFCGVSQAGIVLDPGTQPSLLYGDFFSFSFPLNHNLVTLPVPDGSSPTPGDPFYVASSPGAIKHGVVIGTGAAGKDVNENFSGMDDAYRTVSGTTAFFSTGTTADPPTLGGSGTDPVGDTAFTWDADVAALRSFLTGDFVIIFDHNETGTPAAGEAGLAATDLIAWAQATLSGSPTLSDVSFFFSAFDDPFTLADERTAGLLASAAGGPEPDPSLDLPGTSLPNLDPRWGISHSRLTILPDGTLVHFGPKVPGDPAAAVEINQNIGQNQAEFAVYNPTLDALIKNSDYRDFTLDVRLSRTINGNEQIFLLADTIVNPPRVIPEPSTFVIWSLLAALGVTVGCWRRRNRAA